MWYLIPIAIFLFLVIMYLRSDTRKTAQSSILAERAFKARDYAGAERLFRECHQTAARLPERVRNRCEGEISIDWGHSLYRLGRLADAEDRLRSPPFPDCRPPTPASGILSSPTPTRCGAISASIPAATPKPRPTTAKRSQPTKAPATSPWWPSIHSVSAMH